MINRTYKFDKKSFIIPLIGFVPIILSALYSNYTKEPDLFGRGFFVSVGVIIAAFLAYGFTIARRKVSVDDDGITFQGVFGKKVYCMWKDINKLSENVIMRRIELFGGNNKRIMFVDYQMEKYVELAGIILNNANIDLSGLKTPLTYGDTQEVYKMFSKITISDKGVTIKNSRTTIDLLYSDIIHIGYDYDRSNGGLSVRLYIDTKDAKVYKLIRHEKLPEVYYLLKLGMSGKICRVCQIVNRVESVFCSSCGKEIKK